MTTRSRVILVTVLLTAVAVVGVGVKRLLLSQTQLQSASGILAATVSDAREIVRLRQQSQQANEQKRPEQDLIARIHAAIAAAGLSVDVHFKSLQGEADQAVPGNQHYRQQSVSLSLQQLQPSQLGALLSEWMRSQPVWRPSSIELTHERGQRSEDSNVYSARLTFTAVYVADPSV